MPSETKYQEAAEVTLVFAENVRAIMEKKGLSVAELSRIADVDRSGLSNLLNGKGGNCSLATGQKLAQALGSELWKLLHPRSKK